MSVKQFNKASFDDMRSGRVQKSCGRKKVISFGARRMHPSIAPMIERNRALKEIKNEKGGTMTESADEFEERKRDLIENAEMQTGEEYEMKDLRKRRGFIKERFFAGSKKRKHAILKKK